MIEREKEGIRWLEFELLADESILTHACFLKNGNFSLSTNENREMVTTLLNLESLFVPRLCNRADIFHLTDWPLAQPHCDGASTQKELVGILITHADCQPAIFYDPVNQAIANVHSGWRGSVANIYKNAIEQMGKKFGTLPENLLVCIGPSLGPNSAEFVNYRHELPQSFWEYQTKPNYFDFWEISKSQLKNCGILEHHIEIAEIDTFNNTDTCFSHRRKMTGRMGTIVALNPTREI